MEKEAKILVVDDEERIRRLLKMYLERENYDITEAENGEKALELALDEDFDLILLDIMMPGMDGIEVCQELRKTKATPVMMLTAKGEEANRVQGFEVGTDDYIVKPFSLGKSSCESRHYYGVRLQQNFCKPIRKRRMSLCFRN